jgi:hypothetical protein
MTRVECQRRIRAMLKELEPEVFALFEKEHAEHGDMSRRALLVFDAQSPVLIEDDGHALFEGVALERGRYVVTGTSLDVAADLVSLFAEMADDADSTAARAEIMRLSGLGQTPIVALEGDAQAVVGMRRFVLSEGGEA